MSEYLVHEVERPTEDLTRPAGAHDGNHLCSGVQYIATRSNSPLQADVLVDFHIERHHPHHCAARRCLETPERCGAPFPGVSA